MENNRAVLSSAATTLEGLLAKVSDLAEELQQGGDESLAHDLYEVERALRMAHRRLATVNRRLR